MNTRRKTDTIALRKIMAEQRINTINQLAESSGVSRNTLSKILSGEAQPSAEVMNKLVFALKISPEKAGNIFFSNNLRNAKDEQAATREVS